LVTKAVVVSNAFVAWKAFTSGKAPWPVVPKASVKPVT
jgi:hypothetical protein